MTIQIRQATPADASAIARVHVDSWRSSYANVVPQEILSGLSYDERKGLWDGILNSSRADRHCYVADASATGVVGFAHGGTVSKNSPAFDGEIYAIYLLEEFQRMGLGRRLFISVAQRLLEDGMSSFLLWVFEENHSARRFYESLGGEVVCSQEINIGGANLVEVAYAWNDIERLAG